jgi:hypothetical protein
MWSSRSPPPNKHYRYEPPHLTPSFLFLKGLSLSETVFDPVHLNISMLCYNFHSKIKKQKWINIFCNYDTID